LKPGDAEVWEHTICNSILLVFPWFCMSIVVECGMCHTWKTQTYKHEGLVLHGMPTDGRHKDAPSHLEMWRRIA